MEVDGGVLREDSTPSEGGGGGGVSIDKLGYRCTSVLSRVRAEGCQGMESKLRNKKQEIKLS